MQCCRAGEDVASAAAETVRNYSHKMTAGLELTFFFIADRNKRMEPALTPHEGGTKGGDKEV
jgi:hypothetical protein